MEIKVQNKVIKQNTITQPTPKNNHPIQTKANKKYKTNN
jgi:hypothetical protein